MNDDKVMMFSRTFKKHTLQSVFSEKPITELPPVGIVYYYAGAKPDILTMMAQNHRGIVIIGSGSGNYSQAWLNEIETLAAKGIILLERLGLIRELYMRVMFLILIMSVYRLILCQDKKLECF